MRSLQPLVVFLFFACTNTRGKRCVLPCCIRYLSMGLSRLWQLHAPHLIFHCHVSYVFMLFIQVK